MFFDRARGHCAKIMKENQNMPRKDAKKIRNLDSSKKFYTFLMPRRTTAACWSQLTADASGITAFIDEKKSSGEKFTVFQITVAALIRTASQFPKLNRFIYGHKFYSRKDYTVAFAINTDETTVFRKLSLDPRATVSEVRDIIVQAVSNARTNPHDSLDDSMNAFMRMPDFLSGFILKLYPVMVDKGIFPRKFVEEDILFSSAIVSNLGTFGMSAPYHHLYEWGNASVFLTIGAVEKKPFVMPDDSIRALPAVTFGFTVDERVCEGKDIADALNFFKYCIENPSSLENPPDKVKSE